MIRIIKTWEPKELTQFKKKGNMKYSDLDSDEGKIVKQKLQESLCSEQFGLCAYCMNRITPETMKIEHFFPQNGINKTLGLQKSLDYSNMLAVCDGGELYNKIHNLSSKRNLHCDASKQNKSLSLNPSVKNEFMQMKIRYSSNGKIHSDSINTNFQKEIDSVLNLNIPFLVSMRKAVKMKVIDYVKKTGKITPAKKKEIIKALRTPKDGLLPPFVDVSVFFM